ncbi:MAG: IclR family transcriptional regulator [Ilumatobacteraceae bacterium]
MVNRYPLASVDNALSILELLRSEPTMRLSDVAKELGVANSTAHRLLAALVERGFVVQEPDTRRYCAGPTLMEIGRAAVLHLGLRQLARPLLEELAVMLGETVHLGVRQGKQVRYIDAVESTRAVRVAARTGRVMAANTTSTGKVLLAALDDEVVRALFTADSPPAAASTTSTTSATARQLTELLGELDRCRRAGFAANSGESEDGVVSVAVAVRDGAGEVVAAVSCAAPEHRLHISDASAVAGRMHALVASHSLTSH